MSELEFSALPLHDATIKSIILLWEQKICRIDLLAFAIPGNDATAHALEFSGTSLLIAPRGDAWGPSSSVLSGTRTPNGFSLAMQSGDTIEVAATGYTFAAA
jgi:hypothetical protein